ncbi:MAG TPA: hypothetical protein PK725_04140 [Rhodocyclaceae bacterium]|jgi:diaminobutyrate-2-oxoglutarate transaminase|nr:hypothetical protein [Rhodocyclaceae bacterium]HRQ46113.1 hypothetical protein [Rhodocyclaceae bacterium]
METSGHTGTFRGNNLGFIVAERALIIETAGAIDEVLRFLPPLLIEEELLRDGFRRVDEASDSVVEKGQKILIGEG